MTPLGIIYPWKRESFQHVHSRSLILIASIICLKFKNWNGNSFCTFLFFLRECPPFFCFALNILGQLMQYCFICGRSFCQELLLLCVSVRQFKLTVDLDSSVYDRTKSSTSPVHCHPLSRVYYTWSGTFTSRPPLGLLGGISQDRPICRSLFWWKELYTNLWTARIRLQRIIKLRKLMGIDGGSICSGARPVWCQLCSETSAWNASMLSEKVLKLGLPFPLATCIASNEAIDHSKKLIFVQRT
jgi:hypothetical protein